MIRSMRASMVAILLALFTSSSFAQDLQQHLRRTPEERAMKQTEMLVRDLSINDSLTRDTIYRVHLRYARSRERVQSRIEAIECMNRLFAELKCILTKSQYERLQAIPRRQGARTPQAGKDSLGAEAIQPEP